MDREDIYRRLVETAERYGAGNPQQLKLLRSELEKSHPDEVLAGVLLVFSRSVPTEGNYQKQELAGRMLERLKPSASFDLAQALRDVLPAYNPSIEQVPEYLAGRCGKEAVIAELLRFESEQRDSRASASAKTMRWWLGHQSSD